MVNLGVVIINLIIAMSFIIFIKKFDHPLKKSIISFYKVVDVELFNARGGLIEKYKIHKNKKIGVRLSYDGYGKLLRKCHYDKGELSGESILYTYNGEIRKFYYKGSIVHKDEYIKIRRSDKLNNILKIIK